MAQKWTVMLRLVIRNTKPRGGETPSLRRSSIVLMLVFLPTLPTTPSATARETPFRLRPGFARTESHACLRKREASNPASKKSWDLHCVEKGRKLEEFPGEKPSLLPKICHSTHLVFLPSLNRTKIVRIHARAKCIDDYRSLFLLFIAWSYLREMSAWISRCSAVHQVLMKVKIASTSFFVSIPSKAGIC